MYIYIYILVRMRGIFLMARNSESLGKLGARERTRINLN